MYENINDCHSLSLKDRKNLALTGVREVTAFDEKTVELITVMGGLSIRGESIKIQSFNTESGDMEITGRFAAVIYINDSAKRESFFSKIFR